ncbi:hypothetical protein EDF57_103565 [Novosphingobium sp. PhB55]|uniref:hypothetical protein n=1 Tax=Novosphingobium sp. PhB55 TaxID=2485106 RepID=UPI0010653A24|nr:hypothetical protein [Novosphingobium sp. PhB55]TDW65381.1 hypothetical protein EDF57_103565 [Novosphingobium sp. PhB55]
MGRVLVACERSGVVRNAFIAAGHDAWSCDIEAADDGSNRHIRGDVRDHLDDGWDLLAVMHPPCTVLCNSGAKWLYIGGKKVNGRDPSRWEDLDTAAAFYRYLRDAKSIRRKAVENPVMHRHAIRLTRRGKVQFVQPWHHGDPFFKATGLELIELPKLRDTNRLSPPRTGTAEHKAWSAVHRAPPGPDRARIRSQTFPGIALAMASQWGSLLPGHVEPEQMEMFREAA